MKGQRIICIDAGNIAQCISFGMIPLKEGEIYTVRGEETFGKGTGYLLEGIYNEFNVVNAKGEHVHREPSYAKHRFIPLSEIEEPILEKHMVIL